MHPQQLFPQQHMVTSHGSNKHEKKTMKVYLFADLICIYFTTLGCREEKNGKKRTTQEMPTCSSNPQKLTPEFFPHPQPVKVPQWETLMGKAGMVAINQKMFRSARDPPTSDTTTCLEPAHQTRATSWWESAGRNLPRGSHSTCPPKGWM